MSSIPLCWNGNTLNKSCWFAFESFVVTFKPKTAADPHHDALPHLGVSSRTWFTFLTVT